MSTITAASREDSMVDRLRRWAAGETPGPWGIILMPTNRCNQRCKMCWQRWVESESGRIDYAEVSDDRLLRLVDEASALGVREWTLTGGGEPLTRGDFVMRLCERIRELGMNGGMHTNGILLNRDRIERLIRIGWDCVHFSLDGPTPEINDGIRSNGAFDRACAHIRVMAELKRAHGADRPATTINTVLTNTNVGCLEDMVRLTRELECTAGLFVSGLVVHDAASAEYRLSEEQERALPEHLHQAIALADRLGVPHNLRTFLPENPGRLSARVSAGPFINATCFEAWLTATIVPDGRVGPCCMSWDKDADTINDKTLQEVWVGPYLQEVRRALIAHRGLPPYCQSCHSYIAVRTAEFRAGLRAIEWAQWPEMGWPQRLSLLSRRFSANLRERGLASTLRRAWEWLCVRFR